MIGSQRAFEWMNLLRITSLSRVSVWARMLSLCRNGRTSLTNENEDTKASLLIGRTDNAQLTGGIWFASWGIMTLNDSDHPRVQIWCLSTGHLTCTVIKWITFWCFYSILDLTKQSVFDYESKIRLGTLQRRGIWLHETVLCLNDGVL